VTGGGPISNAAEIHPAHVGPRPISDSEIGHAAREREWFRLPSEIGHRAVSLDPEVRSDPER